MKGKIDEIIDSLKSMDIDKRIESINYIKERLKEVSPFNYEPVECVKWVKQDLVKQNDYNPNVVAPPEMELLHTSNIGKKIVIMMVYQMKQIIT